MKNARVKNKVDKHDFAKCVYGKECECVKKKMKQNWWVVIIMFRESEGR